MTELDILLTVLTAFSSLMAIVFGALTAKRNSRSDISDESQRLTSMEMDLKYIKSSVDDIKNQKLDYRITVLEQKVSTLEDK